MTALERDVMAWAAAKLRFAERAFRDDCGVGTFTDDWAHLRAATVATEAALLARGTKMLAKKGGAK